MNRILKSPFLVNRGKVEKTAKPDVDMSQPPGTCYPLLYSRATHIQWDMNMGIMGNSCSPGPTVTSVGCAYEQRKAARSRKVAPKICVRLTASSQLIQSPSTPTERGPAGLSRLYRRRHCGLKRQLLSVSVIRSLFLSLFVSVSISTSPYLCLCLFVSLGVSVSFAHPLPTHTQSSWNSGMSPTLSVGFHHEMGMASQDPAAR